jgi:hypothetical protein
MISGSISWLRLAALCLFVVIPVPAAKPPWFLQKNRTNQETIKRAKPMSFATPHCFFTIY